MLDNACRICFEEDLHTRLIFPCKCRGTLKFVHEECLKEWIQVKQRNTECPECEVCKTPFRMECWYQKVCSLRQCLNTTVSDCAFIPFLVLALCVHVLVAYVVVVSVKNHHLSAHTECTLFVLFGGICSFILFSTLLINHLYELCVHRELHRWIIHSV